MKQLLIILSFFLSFTSFSQEQNTGEITIQTSAECGSCKDRIEQKLNYTKGIKFAELDLTNMKLLVKYSPKKISADEIRKIISEIGYDADDVKANPKAVKQLPKCCQPGGMKKH